MCDDDISFHGEWSIFNPFSAHGMGGLDEGMVSLILIYLNNFLFFLETDLPK